MPSTSARRSRRAAKAVQRSLVDEDASLIMKLPNELLLNIISYAEQSAIHALSLTSRRMNAVAEQALYTSPKLPEPQIHRAAVVITFAYALVKRPIRQQWVQSIHINTSARRQIHKASRCRTCKKGRMCEKMKMRTLVASAAEEFWARNGVTRELWLKQLLQGYEVAFGGCILLFLQSLKHLRFSDYGIPSHQDPPNLYNDDCFCSTAVFGTGSGGNIWPQPLYRSTIPGLRILESVRVDGRVPFELVDVTRPEDFEIGLYPINRKICQAYGAWCSLRAVTVLSVWLDVRLLCNNLQQPYSLPLISMVVALPRLKQLTIRFEAREAGQDLRSLKWANYTPILGVWSRFNVPKLETLDIDTSRLQDNLGPSEMKNINNFLQGAEPFGTHRFHVFPNLRYIKAPQNALMSTSLHQDPTQANSTYLLQGRDGIPFFERMIEVIEVTDIVWGTITAWGHRLLEWKNAGQLSLVRLRKVVLNWDASGAGTEVEQMQMSARNDSVWSELWNVGVEVEHRLSGQPLLSA
ncbi:hypothetical protein P171DRAFT_469181 [Karstenula rhodostoma CBS 690.94]|uniref:F-box domain-containing protein n=1 Tax=Karstenula rhodostoma CBS 690.94 TaxID=1392251 RepID=A0A9P4PVI9_9PLEO|nr:hypothetical protein P171DRAFT_469181 [Karstenula rhodostoma CBS 690.94]